MREKFNAALKAAVKAQDKRRMSTLRLINAAIKDRDIAARTQGRDDGVSDDQVLEILVKMVKQRQESIKSFEEGGRLDLAQQEQEEIDIIQSFMPKQLSEKETRKVCEQLVGEIGAAGLKDMGRCMNTLKERYPGQMDFAKASQHVKDMLK